MAWEFYVFRDYHFYSKRFIEHVDIEFKCMCLYVQTYLFMVLSERKMT